jgi:hypothetical protein
MVCGLGGCVFAAPPPIRAVRASSQVSRAAGASASRCRGRMRRRWVRGIAERGGGGLPVCAGGWLWAWVVGCAAQSDSQMRTSPSDLDFQPVPVHGKKLNQ